VKPIDDHSTEVDRAEGRDTVEGLEASAQSSPAIVSLSDIHGYLDAARSALLTPSDHSAYDALVRKDEDGRLHWADNDYVLVFNGDLVDRGPRNEDVLSLVARLVREAPAGRVRVTLGNHEAISLSPKYFNYQTWYSGQVDQSDRDALISSILDGVIVAAYRGHNVTYAHAGGGDSYDVAVVNEALQDATAELSNALGTETNVQTQRQVLEDYAQVLGIGSNYVKGEGAGLVWLDFAHLPDDAPPQVVGHTRFDEPQQKGAVFCQNILRENQGLSGGEGVFVETTDELRALIRSPSGTVDDELLTTFKR
jgi:hypothetical protein